MNKKLLPLLIAGVCAMPSAFAASDAAILKRLDQLEAQRKADQAEIQALRNKVQQLETQKPVNSDEATKLREEIVSVDKKAQSRTESVKRSIDAERDKLKINGYMSVYGVKATDSAVTLGNGVDNHWGFRPDTVAAIQFDYKVSDQFDAVVQLQSSGKDGYDVEASLAFLRYNLSPNTKIRAGRMVAPIYLYADSIDVGYTYPWVRPPFEMYGSGPIYYQGFDLLQSFNVGGWNNTLQILGGDNDNNPGDTKITGDYIVGAGLTSSKDSWTLRASYTRAGNVAFVGAPFSGAIDYWSGAVRYDNGALFALVEGKHVLTDGTLEFVVPDVDGFYTTWGYQLNEFMPYVTWAKSYSFNDADTIKQSQESIGLGLRYNLTDKVVLKGEATKYDHFDGTAGVSSFADAVADPAVINRLDRDGVTIMSFGFDAIF